MPTTKKTTTRKAKPAAKRRVADDITQGMRELDDWMTSGRPLAERFTVRTVTRVAAPGEYDAARVKAVRAKVGASQAVFAELVGVSRDLVCGWEIGTRTPAPVARRVLDEIDRDPAKWARLFAAA
jgi:putative transcriptional regulator